MNKIHFSAPPLFGWESENINANEDNYWKANIAKVLGYVPIIGSGVGIVRLIKLIANECFDGGHPYCDQVNSSHKYFARNITRIVIETLSLGFILALVDLIITIARCWEAHKKTSLSATQSVSQRFSESNKFHGTEDDDSFFSEDTKFHGTEAENPLENLLNFQNRPGRHTVKSPVVGSRAAELLAVKKAMESEPILAQLQKAIYKGPFIYLIPTTKKDEADDVAQGLFLDYISKYSIHGCTEQNIVDWSESGMPGCASNKMHIYDEENEANTWRVHAIVEARHGIHNEKYDRYLPPHVVAYHELMHVEETPLKAKESSQGKNGNELLTVIKTIILLDTVYKEIHGIKETDEVDYNQFIEIKGTKIQLGRFANFYRQKEAEVGKLYLALISRDSIEFLKGRKKIKQLI